MVGYYNTCSVCKDGQVVGRFCSFKKEKCAEGGHWDIHKGRLQPSDYSDVRKVMVKVWPDPNLSHSECDSEVKKLDCAEVVLQMFPELAADFAVAKTYAASVYKECRRKEKKRKTVKDGTKVIVQDRFDGQIRLFLDLEEEKKPIWDSQSRSPYHNLVLASYRASGGTCVISGVKGVNLRSRNFRRKGDFDDDYGSAKFLITSLTIHSVTKEFGSKDKGKAGIETFLKSAGTAVPGDLKDAEIFAEKLKAKTALREKPVQKTPREDTCTVQSSSSDDSWAPWEESQPENTKVKDSAILLGLLDVALTPSSCWSGNHHGRYFMGKYYSDSEDEH
nr:hypothetical protein BaRGS_022461 [Batillaria attramentaria]